MGKTSRSSWWMFAVMGVLAGRAANAQPRYHVRVLDVDDRTHLSWPQALNDAGNGVGLVVPASEQEEVWGVLWKDGIVRLPGLPGVSQTAAYDINLAGLIAGYAGPGPTETSMAQYRPVIWENGQPRELAVPPGMTNGYAHTLNANGDAAGSVWNAQGTDRYMAYWHDGEVTLLSPDPGWIYALNSKRQIAGDDTRPGFPNRGSFIWENGQFTWLPGLTADGFTSVQDMNEAGVVVGSAGTATGSKPVIWQNGSVSALTMPPEIRQGAATHINDRGEILGLVGLYGRPAYRPTSGGGFWDLWSLIDFGPSGPGDLRWLRVWDINSKGQILASLDRIGPNPPDHGQVVVLEPFTPTGADTQPPALTITSPSTGTYANDLVVLQATATDNVGVVGVQFYADTGTPSQAAIGPEDTTPPYSVEWDLASLGENGVDTPITFWAVARDAAGNTAVTNLKSIVYRNRCNRIETGGIVNNWLGNQSGTFTVRWTGQVSAGGGPIEAGFGLARGQQSNFPGTSAAVLFAPDGEIKARNGASYPPSGVRYTEDWYHFRMVVDVPNNRYSVWYKLANQPERPLASNFAFRKANTLLDDWFVHMDEANPPGVYFNACNVRVSAN